MYINKLQYPSNLDEDKIIKKIFFDKSKFFRIIKTKRKVGVTTSLLFKAIHELINGNNVLYISTTLFRSENLINQLKFLLGSNVEQFIFKSNEVVYKNKSLKFTSLNDYIGIGFRGVIILDNDETKHSDEVITNTFHCGKLIEVLDWSCYIQNDVDVMLI